MVERTVKLYDCDRCGKPGRRYTVLFEDGAKVMDRCETHDKQLEKLREEPGDWLPHGAGKPAFKVSSPDDINRAVAESRLHKK